MLRRSEVSKAIYFLLILTIVGLLGNITQIGLQVGYGYIGNGETNKILDTTITCTHTYINNKYDLPLANKQILSALILCCVSAVCLIIMLVVLITFLLQLCSLNSKTQDSHCYSITHLKIKALYIMCSISLLSATIYFSKFLGFYLEGLSECKQSIYKNQWIYIMSVAALSFFVTFISWFIILILNAKMIKYLDDNTVVLFRKQEDYSKREVQMQNYEDKKSIQKLITRNYTQEALKQEEYIFKKNDNYEDYRIKSPERLNPLFKVQEKEFDKKSNYLKPKPDFIHKSSSNTPPNYNSPQKYIYQPYFQSGVNKKNLEQSPKKKQYEQRVIDESDKYNKPRNNLNSNYFKGDQEIRKPNYFSNQNNNQKKQQLRTPKKRGMLMDYIRGKYVD